MKKIKMIAAALVVMVGIVAPLLVPSVAGAASTQESLCKGSGGTWSGSTCTPAGGGTSFKGFIGQITNILAFVAGAIAVIYIIFGGIRYITSNGDQSSVTSAKNTILYAVVGLVVVIVAYAVVGFVITNIK